jgi:hypothetical protein
MNEKILQSLCEVAGLLNGNKINWMLIGSANLALWGMNFEPNDIDIVVDLQDEERVLDLMKEHKLLKTEKLLKRKTKERMFLVGEKVVEFVFENSQGFYLKYLLAGEYVKKNINDKNICCMKLENEVLAYENLDRKEKAGMIKDFLKKTKKDKKQNKLLKASSGI